MKLFQKIVHAVVALAMLYAASIASAQTAADIKAKVGCELLDIGGASGYRATVDIFGVLELVEHVKPCIDELTTKKAPAVRPYSLGVDMSPKGVFENELTCVVVGLPHSTEVVVFTTRYPKHFETKVLAACIAGIMEPKPQKAPKLPGT